jgi:inhibitor of KinA sporulation pathway (predicted exonuclease)
MGIDPKHTLEFEGTPHMALDDAKHQIRYVTEIVKKAMEVGERENG